LLANKIVLEGLSVRDAEELVLKHSGGASQPKQKAATNYNRDTQRLEEELSSVLGAPARIKQSNTGGGKLIIEYSNNDQLNEFLKRLRKGA
ncbi:MAG: chromosome partitioning protein ParB, partial [Gallionella sp.]